MTPYIFQCTVYDDDDENQLPDHKSSSNSSNLILLDARHWYRSKSLLAGLLLGCGLETLWMHLILPEDPRTITVIVSRMASYCFGLMTLLGMFLCLSFISAYRNNPARLQSLLLWFGTMAITGSMLTYLSEHMPYLNRKDSYSLFERHMAKGLSFIVTRVTYSVMALLCYLVGLYFCKRQKYYQVVCRGFPILRRLVVFIGGFGMGANAALVLASFLGVISPVTLDADGRVYDSGSGSAPLAIFRIILMVAMWVQEKVVMDSKAVASSIAAGEGKDHSEPLLDKKQSEEECDMIEYSFLC